MIGVAVLADGSGNPSEFGRARVSITA